MTSDKDVLFSDMQNEGLSQNASLIVVENLNPLTNAGAQGASIDDIAGDEVTLYCLLLDQSSSMSIHKNTVELAQEEHMKALSDSKNADNILVSEWVFNTRVDLLHGYESLDKVPKITLVPNGATSLYEAILNALVSVVDYGNTLRRNGIRTKIVVDIFTDGEDNSSTPGTLGQAKTLIEDLLRQEIYQIVLVSFGQGYAQKIARDLGIKEVLEADSDPSSIRRAFNERSKSVIATSQNMIGGGSANSFFS